MAGQKPRKKLVVYVATLGPAGHFPLMPGTAGSAVTAGIIALIYFAGGPFDVILAVVTALVLIVSVPVSSAAEAYFGKSDPGEVVIDEAAGMLLAFIFISPANFWAALVFAFVAFRAFDIIKPGFKRVQNLPRGWGIVADDVIAGLAANALLRAAIYFLGL